MTARNRVLKVSPRQKGRLKRLLVSCSLLVVVTLATLLLINAIAYLLFVGLRSKREGVSVGKYFVSPLSPEGMAILKKVRGTDDEGLLRTLASGDPGIRPHTVLHFTEGFSRPYYTVGVDGVRYESGWSDEQVEGWMGETGTRSFLLGGSTAFGHGVTDDETLAAFLNRQEGEARNLNLGVEAYDSLREVDKLLHLLRKGRRPKRVIFLDGLNDVTTFAWTPYEAFDKPRTQGMILDRGEVPLVFGFPRRNNMLAAFTFSFPVVQLLHRLKADQGAQAGAYRPKSPDREPIDWAELMRYYEGWDRIQVGRADALAQELADYYLKNIAFVRQLAEAFGFEPLFVYQPIGLLETDQPFLRPEFRESDSRRIFAVVAGRLRRDIESGRLDMIDCSQALSGMSDGYVDASHYSAQGNRRLAECILAAAAR